MPNYAPGDYLQFILSGLSTGSIYVLIALGIVTIYSVTGIINLAQGEYTMLGAMLSITYVNWHIPLAIAFLGAVITVVIIGMIVERLTVNPVRTASPVTLIIITVGVSIVIRGIALLIWGATPYSLQAFSSGGPLNLFGAVISLQRLWIMGTAALVLALLYFLLDRTLLGKALRACSINQDAARLMGISPSQMSLFTFGLSAALGAVAGIVIAPLTLATYDMGLMLGLKGFVAAVIGGLVSAPGAVIGGLLLGVLESLAAGLISSSLKDAIAFVVLLVVILVRSGNIFAIAGTLKHMKGIGQLWHRSPNLYGLLIFALIIGLLPLFMRSQYLLSTAIFIGIASILTLGLCMLMGYAGQISLGHAAFYGLGAYVSAVLTVKLGLSPWIALLLGIVITGTMAYLIGKVIFRLSGHYLAVATLGLGIVVFLAFGEFGELTGGSSGLPGVPRLSVGSFVFDKDIEYYYLVWAVLVVLMAVSLNIVNSRVGRGLRAIHGSEVAADSMGIDSSRYKLQVLVLSAIYASIAGSLYVHYMRFVSPQPFDFHASVELVVMAAVGGLASVWGAPFGAAAIILLTTILRDNLPHIIPNASGEHTVIAYGIILVVIMIYMPRGLTHGLVNMGKWRFSRSKR